MRNQSWKHWLWSYYCPTLGRGVWLVLEVNWVLCRNSLPMSKVSTQTSGREDTAFAQISKNNRISLIVRHSGETRRKTSWYASGYPEKSFCCGFFISLPLNPPCQCLSMQDAPYPQPACSPSRRKRICSSHHSWANPNQIPPPFIPDFSNVLVFLLLLWPTADRHWGQRVP